MELQAVSFRVTQDDLADAVAWVARSLPSKPTQPVLRAMLITAYTRDLNSLVLTMRFPPRLASPLR